MRAADVSGAPARLGIIGGTFDPVHLGHLAAAAAARDALALDEVRFIPSHHPPHRPAVPTASAFHRFAMVALAISPHARFTASDFELRRNGPSFTADTLRALHASGYPASALFFIIGTDAFAEIATWHEYPDVLDLAHFVVVSRPGHTFDDLRARVPEWLPRVRQADVAVQDRPASAVGAATGPASGGTLIFLVPAATPDVSSTAIRARAARGASLEGLVAPEVERHIRRHRLYA